MGVKHKIECDGEVFYRSAPKYKPYALCIKTRAHTWNWLGKKGQSHYKGIWFVRLFGSRETALKKYRESKSHVFKNVSNEIGDNSHLEGLPVNDVVEIVETEIVPTGYTQEDKG